MSGWTLLMRTLQGEVWSLIGDLNGVASPLFLRAFWIQDTSLFYFAAVQASELGYPRVHTCQWGVCVTELLCVEVSITGGEGCFFSDWWWHWVPSAVLWPLSSPQALLTFPAFILFFCLFFIMDLLKVPLACRVMQDPFLHF